MVGLDPKLAFIPEQIQKKSFAEYGETLEGAADAIWQFNKGIVDAVCDLIPAVKPLGAVPGGVEALRFTRKNITLLAVFTVIGLAAVILYAIAR